MIPTQNDDKPYAGLSNAEILLAYYKLKQQKEKMDAVIKDKVLYKLEDTPLGIKAVSVNQVPADHAEQLQKSEYYQTLCNILEKLAPTVFLIEECDDSVSNLLTQVK